MRLLANENFPGDAVAAPIAAGHDVVWVREDAPGMAVAEVLAWAMREGRVLLTFDEDFGEFAWLARLPASYGVVQFRLPMPAASSVGAALVARIAERENWAGYFCVVEPGRTRMRPLA